MDFRWICQDQDRQEVAPTKREGARYNRPMHERATSHRTDYKPMMTKQPSRRVPRSDERTNDRRAKEKATSTSIRQQPTKPAGKENETSVEQQQSSEKPAPDLPAGQQRYDQGGGLRSTGAAVKGTTATAQLTASSDTAAVGVTPWSPNSLTSQARGTGGAAAAVVAEEWPPSGLANKGTTATAQLTAQLTCYCCRRRHPMVP